MFRSMAEAVQAFTRADCDCTAWMIVATDMARNVQPAYDRKISGIRMRFFRPLGPVGGYLLIQDGDNVRVETADSFLGAVSRGAFSLNTPEGMAMIEHSAAVRRAWGDDPDPRVPAQVEAYIQIATPATSGTTKEE